MDWGYKEIEINGLECLNDRKWLASLSHTNRELIDDESAFFKRFRLSWNYVERVAMIRLKMECGLVDMQIRFLGRIGALQGTAVGALFRVSSLVNRLSNIAAFMLGAVLFVLGSLFLVSVEPTWHSLLQFVLFMSAFLIALEFVFRSFRPWAIFQRCEKYRQQVVAGTSEMWNDLESNHSAKDLQSSLLEPRTDLASVQHAQLKSDPNVSKSGTRKERDTALGIIAVLLDMDRELLKDNVDAKRIGGEIERLLIDMKLPARRNGTYADWIREARALRAAGQINKEMNLRKE